MAELETAIDEIIPPKADSGSDRTVKADADEKVVALFFFKPTKSIVKLVPDVCIAFNELEIIPELAELFPYMG